MPLTPTLQMGKVRPRDVQALVPVREHVQSWDSNPKAIHTWSLRHCTGALAAGTSYRQSTLAVGVSLPSFLLGRRMRR